MDDWKTVIVKWNEGRFSHSFGTTASSLVLEDGKWMNKIMVAARIRVTCEYCFTTSEKTDNKGNCIACGAPLRY